MPLCLSQEALTAAQAASQQQQQQDQSEQRDGSFAGMLRTLLAGRAVAEEARAMGTQGMLHYIPWPPCGACSKIAL